MLEHLRSHQTMNSSDVRRRSRGRGGPSSSLIFVRMCPSSFGISFLALLSSGQCQDLSFDLTKTPKKNLAIPAPDHLGWRAASRSPSATSKLPCSEPRRKWGCLSQDSCQVMNLWMAKCCDSCDLLQAIIQGRMELELDLEAASGKLNNNNDQAS